MQPYWPAWQGALALGAITVAFWAVVRRPLGVSGIWGRFTRLGEERGVDRAERAARGRGEELARALDRATREAMAEAGERLAPRGPVAGSPRAPEPAPRPTLGAHAVFLAGLVLGGVLARLASGARVDPGLGPAFAALVGDGPRAAIVLGAGGLLVGLGVTLAAGCPSGHGLSGCSRLERGSLVAVLFFFAAAAAAARLLGGVPA